MSNLNPIWREPFYTVEEFFDWKLKADSYDSVEKHNKDFTDLLKWDRTDTLYSFQKIYQIGLQLPKFKEQYSEARKTIKGRVDDRTTQSDLCKLMGSINEEIEKTGFLSVYFNLGNVIPIWPGGNQDKGAGYDFPETYFTDENNRYWTEKLLEKYPNACMDDVLNNRIDVGLITTDSGAYFDYLCKRRDIIIDRTKKLSEEINKILGNSKTKER